MGFPVVTGLTGNDFNIKVRLQFYQHGGRYERCSLTDRPNSHFIVVMACRCIARILHGVRQATKASQKYKFSSISKQQDGKHFLVRAGENVAVCIMLHVGRVFPEDRSFRLQHFRPIHVDARAFLERLAPNMHFK